MIIVIDNYDSFTYNLVQYLGDLGAAVSVIRNDQATPEQIIAKKPEGIVISPGPSDPDHAGICLPLIKLAEEKTMPLFGVCLGLQSIGQAMGGKVVRAPRPMHGKTSMVRHKGGGIFAGVPSPFQTTRYHSLIVDKGSLPPSLEITAESEDDNLIMALSHKIKPIHSVQFHPESIATEHGHQILKNFLAML